MKIRLLDNNLWAILTVMNLIIVGCEDRPKVIEANVSSVNDQSTGIFAEETLGQKGLAVENNVSLWHKVKVEKVLPASRYVYLYVSEGSKKYWLATNKMAIGVGDSFKYKGGLLKTDFESKEHRRTFDRLYLVSDVVPLRKVSQPKPAPSVTKAKKIPGTITIAELVNNKEKYANQIVTVSGLCSKINPNIMGRHWIHIKDGTMDDYDLVVTSQTAIPQGHPVAMEAKVVLNRDFGSGYNYAILLEEGRPIAQK